MAELLLLAVFVALLFWVGSLSRQIRELTDRLRTLEQDRRPEQEERAPAPSIGSSSSASPSSAPASSPSPWRPAPAPVLAAPAVPAATHARAADQSLEVEIGSRWALIAGVVVLVLGVAFFVK